MRNAFRLEGWPREVANASEWEVAHIAKVRNNVFELDRYVMPLAA